MIVHYYEKREFDQNISDRRRDGVRFHVGCGCGLDPVEGA